MARRHMDWPLGARVLVIGTTQGDLEGTVGKHWREHPHACTVDFGRPVLPGDPRNSHLVPLRRMRLLDKTQRVKRPWWRERRWAS